MKHSLTTQKSSRWALMLTVALYALLFFTVLAVCKNVYLSGDDFFYSTFTQSGVANFFRSHVQHYQLANGRVLVHFFGTLLLGTNLWVWRILNALGITFVAFACVGLAKPSAQDRYWVCAAAVAMILVLDTQITRQSFYWLIGSMNYIYPLIMLLLYWLALEHCRKMDRFRWYLPVLAVFAGASTEQAALMAIGISLLYPLTDLVYKTRRPTVLEWICLVLTILGFASVVLAPGLRSRANQTASPVDGGVVSLILYNLKYQGKQLFFASYTRTLQLALYISGFSLLVQQFFAEKHRRLQWLQACSLFFGLAGLVLQIWLATAASLPSPMLVRLIRMIAIFGEIVTLAVPALTLYCRKQDQILLFSLILAFGSQLAMTASSVYGPRVLCSFIVMAMLYLCRSFSLSKQPLGLALIAGVWFYLDTHPVLLVIAVLALILQFVRKPKLAALAAAAVILLAGAPNWYRIVRSTAQNAVVYRENLSLIAQYTPEEGNPLVQHTLPNELAIWVMPYQNSYYDAYYKATYHLPYSTEITWN